MTVIGTTAFDPAFQCNAEDGDVRIAAYAHHRQQYLADHGYAVEAAALRARSCQTNRLVSIARKQIPEEYAGLDSLRRFPLAFINCAAVLAVLAVTAILWLGSRLIRSRLGTTALWDRRAGVTSALLCSLIFAPISVDFFRSLEEEGLRQNLSGKEWMPPEPWHVDPKFLIIPAIIVALALLIGLMVMLIRAPRDAQSRSMPAASLIALYLVVFGVLVYLHGEMGIRGIPNDYGIMEVAPRISYTQIVFAPALLLILYAFLRAAQARFGRLRQSFLPTLLTSLRYGSAVVLAVTAIGYLCLMLPVTRVGTAADDYARHGFDREAAAIRTAFR